MQWSELLIVWGASRLSCIVNWLFGGEWTRFGGIWTLLEKYPLDDLIFWRSISDVGSLDMNCTTTTMNILDDPTSWPLGHPMLFARAIMVQIFETFVRAIPCQSRSSR